MTTKLTANQRLRIWIAIATSLHYERKRLPFYKGDDSGISRTILAKVVSLRNLKQLLRPLNTVGIEVIS